MPIDQKKMLQSVYDTLFGAYVTPPAGVPDQGSEDPRMVYLTLEWPGRPILEADVANAWSPQNNKGVMSATENFSRIVNDIPQTVPIFTPTGKTISDAYRDVTIAQVTPPPESPEEKKAYAKADAVLWADGQDYDDAGKPITVKKPHPMYLAYKKARLAYQNALGAYITGYLGYDMSKPEDQRKWSLLGPTLHGPVDGAMDDWQAAHKTRIEDALATIAQSSNNQVGVVFREAAERFNQLKQSSLKNPGSTFSPSYASPSNWFAPSAADIWTTATITSDHFVSNEHSDFESIKSQASGGWGLWSASGGFSKDTSHKDMDSQTDNLTVSFKYARVDIDRPWFNPVLFGLDGWKTTATGKHGYSDGTKNQPTAIFPLLPVSFIAVRDLSITAKFTATEQHEIHQRMETNASFGWGPFSVGGSYASGSDDKHVKNDFDGKTITNNGLQIVGWISTVLPPSPPMDFK